MYPQSMFRAKNRKNIKKTLLKIFQFLQLKNLCILHGRVFITLRKIFPCNVQRFFSAVKTKKCIRTKNDIFINIILFTTVSVGTRQNRSVSTHNLRFV